MKNIDLEKYKLAWKNEPGFNSHKLSDEDIRKFLQANSKNINRLFKTGLSFDIVLKSLLAISFIVLIVLFANQSTVTIVNALLIVLTLGGIMYQIGTFRKVPGNDHPPESIRTSLKVKTDFYNKHYIKSLLVGALSNSLFFLSGIMYYFYFKYNEIRPLEVDDYLVFGGAVILGFAIGAFIQIKQHNFQIGQLESCLKDIDEDTLSEYNIKEYRNQRTKNILIASISVILGLLLLSYLLFR